MDFQETNSNQQAYLDKLVNKRLIHDILLNDYALLL